MVGIWVIDTIKIGWRLDGLPSTAALEERGWRPRYDIRSGRISNLFYVAKNFPGSPVLSLFVAPDGQTYSSISVSLPNFLNGSNVKLLTTSEVRHGLELLSAVASDLTMSKCDVQYARVRSVDFAANLQVDPLMISKVINLIAQMSVKGYRRTRYASTSVYFHWNVRGTDSRHRTIAVYSKQHERAKKVESAEEKAFASGIIRVESRFRKTAVVESLASSMGLENAGVRQVITPAVAAKVLDPLEHQILQLIANSERNDPAAILKEYFSPRRADYLISHLFHLKLYGEDYYKNTKIGRSRNAYLSLRRDCRKAGVVSLDLD